MRRVLVFVLLLAVLAPTAMLAQDESARSRFAIALLPVANVPILAASDVLRLGSGAHLSLWYTLGQLPLVVDLTVSNSQSRAIANPDATIFTLAGGLGLLVRYAVIPRLAVRAGGRVSYGQSFRSVDGVKENAGAVGWWGGAGLEFTFADAWSAALEVGATAHANTYVGLEAGIGIVFRPRGTAGEPRVRPERVRPEPVAEVAAEEATPDVADEPADQAVVRETVEHTREDLQLLAAGFDVVFPVFYRYYDSNPVGSVTFRNQSTRPISNIELVVNIPRFMDVAQKQAVPNELAAGEEVQIPLNVLFNDGLLGVTEGTRVAGEFRVAYEIGGSSESYEVDAPLNIADRNAMTWDDDRKAASFVTAKEPNVLTFAKNVSSVVRSVGYATLNTPFRTGMAMLETMALQGINYVVDPTSPYAEFSNQPFVIDFLQFPQQTFQFRAGDCDDLAICYASNLQAVGVQAAFITIPGHLYSAFSTGLTEAQARSVFNRADDLIIHDGIAWIPVETTLLQDGFLEAWKIGARQWRENTSRDQARLIPIEAAWEVYQPVGFDFQSQTAIVVPSPDAIETAYSLELQRFITQEIRPQVARLETRIEATGDPRQINRLGVLYARYGMFDEAEQKFKEALAEGPQADAYLNLGNLEFLRGDLLEAADLYEQAQDLAPENPSILLAVAKVHHELENYGMAERAYTTLQEVAPLVAADFEYLQFRGSDAGRASDAADQRNVIIWGEEEE